MHGSERKTKRKRLLLATKRAYILTVAGVTEMREGIVVVVVVFVVVVGFFVVFFFFWGGGGGAARANDTKAMLIMCKRETERRG